MNQPPLNPDALDNLATVVFGFDIEEWNEHDEDEKRQLLAPYVRTIETYLADAQPVVNSVEELEALPVDSVVLDDAGAVLRKWCEDTWYKTGDEHFYSDGYIVLPARVLYRPEVKP